MSTEQKIIKNKIGLLRLAEELGNVSRACKVMSYSRDTFDRYQPSSGGEKEGPDRAGRAFTGAVYFHLLQSPARQKL